jgi:hypothetical protein
MAGIWLPARLFVIHLWSASITIPMKTDGLPVFSNRLRLDDNKGIITISAWLPNFGVPVERSELMLILKVTQRPKLSATGPVGYNPILSSGKLNTIRS